MYGETTVPEEFLAALGNTKAGKAVLRSIEDAPLSDNIDDRRGIDGYKELKDRYVEILNTHPPGKKRDQLVNDLVDGELDVVSKIMYGAKNFYDYMNTGGQLQTDAGFHDIGKKK